MNVTDIFKENKVCSLSEERRKEAELRHFGLENNDPIYSEEKCNGVNAKIAGESYYNPDEAIKQAMIKFANQAEQAIKSVKVKREGLGQFMCTEKDIPDIRAQFPEGKHLITPPGPFKIFNIRKIKKWFGVICAFDVNESEIGFFKEKRKVYTLDNVRVFFYHKNSDGIGSEIILKNKFMRTRKRAGKSKNIQNSKESSDPTKSEEAFDFKIAGIIAILIAGLGVTISDWKKSKRDIEIKKEFEKNKEAIFEMKEELKDNVAAKKISEAVSNIAEDFKTIFDKLKLFPEYFKKFIDKNMKNGSIDNKFNFITEDIIKDSMYSFDGLDKIKYKIIEYMLKDYNIKSLNELNKVKEISYSCYIFSGEEFCNKLDKMGSKLYDEPDLREDFSSVIWENAFKEFSEKYIVSKLKTKDIDYGCFASWSAYGINLTQKI